MWYFCKRENIRPPGSRKATLDEHLAWMKAQHDAGAIIMSGPSPDLKYGMYLIRAASTEQATQIAASDPYTVKGDSVFELTPWDIRQIMSVGRFTAAELGLENKGI
jgi:uncharacterized protein YciI